MSDEYDRESFTARLNDMCTLAEKRKCPVYSAFLNEREQYDAKSFLGRRYGVSVMFWGGNDACVRKMLRVCDESGKVPDGVDGFPVWGLTITFRKADKPGHRDFLGAFMALGIKRETVGDIFIGEGAAAVFCTKTAHDMICECITSVGRIGVSVYEGITDEAVGYILPVRFEDISVNTASLRSDCIVAGVTGMSREKAQMFIRSGGFMLNYSECDNISRIVSSGDILTMRGHGKFIVGEDIETTRKGRLRLELKKYI